MKIKLFVRLESMEADMPSIFETVVGQGNESGPLKDCRKLFQQYKAGQSVLN